jgi:catechol 2,3-dioxygenase-like lactoylglutathione lyase family enzyme
MMRGAIHHVELYVSDLQHSVAFWGWLLGELGYTEYQAWPEGRSWILSGTYIVLVQTPPDQIGAGYHRRRTGLNHIAFQVESRQAVDDFTAQLRERGVEVLYEDRHPYAGGGDSYAVFFEDPDRIKLEISARGPASPELLDEG